MSEACVPNDVIITAQQLIEAITTLDARGGGLVEWLLPWILNDQLKLRVLLEFEPAKLDAAMAMLLTYDAGAAAGFAEFRAHQFNNVPGEPKVKAGAANKVRRPNRGGACSFSKRMPPTALRAAYGIGYRLDTCASRVRYSFAVLDRPMLVTRTPLPSRPAQSPGVMSFSLYHLRPVVVLFRHEAFS
jgi:hypothetical protein